MTRGRSATISSRKEITSISASQTRPASVAAVRAGSISRAPSLTLNRPASTVPTHVNSAANTRPASAVPPKGSSATAKSSVRRPGTSLGIRSRENTTRVAGKLMVPKRTETKTPSRQEPQTHLVEALAEPISQSALDDEFLFDV
jgi:hypothetical protein